MSRAYGSRIARIQIRVAEFDGQSFSVFRALVCLNRNEAASVLMARRFHESYDRSRDLSRILAGRVRARMLAWRGAHVGAKARIGAGVRADRPWGLTLGARCEVESDVWFKIVFDQALCRIGDFVFLGRGVELDVSLQIEIGDHVLIAPGVFITDHQHRILAGERIGDQGCHSAPVVIEAGAWLGVRSVVLPGVRIGRGAVVGAGAVVTRDVPANAIVAGVPARLKRYREDAPDGSDGVRS